MPKKNYKYGEARPEDGYIFVGYDNGRPDFRNPKSFKKNYEKRNSNQAYLEQEKERLSSSPIKFLGRWVTKSRYEARNGLKDKIADDVTKEWLESIWKKVEGHCMHSQKKMTIIKGKGVVETNVAVGRKNVTKPFTGDNLILVQHQYYRDYN